MREAEVRALLLDPTTKTPVLLLKDRHSTKAMPIWIGEQEAMSIAIELQGHTFPRPLSHDLMKELLNTLGGNLERAVITSVKDDTSSSMKIGACVGVANPSSDLHRGSGV